MRSYFRVTIIIACTILYLPASAEQVRQLSWEDLIPEHLIAEDPFANLTLDQQDLGYWVISMKENMEENLLISEQEGGYSLIEDMNKAIQELEKAGVDIDEVMAKRDEILVSIVEDLNGKRVRIPGYLLPLEMSGAGVTEFLLVPYVGACIHTPPPPPNQIVYVKFEKSGGYNQKELFEPVWVKGVISAKSMTKGLYLSDGSSDIDIGYSMEADKIEAYK